MGTLASSRISQTRFRFVSTKQRKAKKGFLMVAQHKLIAWSKAALHAVIFPSLLFSFTPFGWALSLAYLTFSASLYATTFVSRSAALPFALLAPIALIVIVMGEALSNDVTPF
jgi:hypothetical protein